MTEPEKDWSVIIVGAGPVGLALATELGSKAIPTLLLEKNPSTSRHSKAITIWPPAQEVLNRFGILGQFEEYSLCFEELSIADAATEKTLVRFPFYEVGDKTPFPRLLILPQNKTEALLFKNLRQLTSVDVRFGAEATGINQESEGVSIRYRNNGRDVTARARYLVGCDGGNSFVRSALGVKLSGMTFPVMAGLADVRLREQRNFHSPRISTKNRLCVGFYLGEYTWRLVFINSPGGNPTLDTRRKQAVEALLGNSKYECLWQSEFQLHRRTSETFALGNIVLAGDAAHLNSPVGGQGMNAGIIDTLSLAPALIEALDCDSPEPLLKYASKRKKGIEQGVNRNTGRITSLLLFRQGRFVKLLMRLLSLLLKIPFLRRRFLLKMTLLD